MIDVDRTAEAAGAPEAGAAPASAGARELPRARYRERSRIRIAVLIAVNLIGLMAFLWPFLLPLAPGVNENHRIDGPLILCVLLLCPVPCSRRTRRGGLGPKAVALLGVRGAMVARPLFVFGFSAMFIVVLWRATRSAPASVPLGTFASDVPGWAGPWLPFRWWRWAGSVWARPPPGGSWRVRIGSLRLEPSAATSSARS